MSGRGHLTVPGVMRHGPPPGNGTQIDEINHLVMENKRLATSIAAMRQDRAIVDEEIRRVKAHIRSIETESDIQIRVLLEKIARMELGLKAGESVKKDLQQAHKDAQSLVAARQELTLKIKQASQDLDKWHTDIKRIPELLSKLDSMKLEHQRLRSAFEHEKHMNLDLVEHMQAKEKTLVSMDRELPMTAHAQIKMPNTLLYTRAMIYIMIHIEEQQWKEQFLTAILVIHLQLAPSPIHIGIGWLMIQSSNLCTAIEIEAMKLKFSHECIVSGLVFAALTTPVCRSGTWGS